MRATSFSDVRTISSSDFIIDLEMTQIMLLIEYTEGALHGCDKENFSIGTQMWP